MRTHKANGKRAFTLIELMVVVLVIMILSGILFRLAALVQDRAARSRVVYQLQQIQNALNEFYAEYGHYPPVDFVEYEFEAQRTNMQTRYMEDTFIPSRNNPDEPDMFFPDRRVATREDDRVSDRWPYAGTRPWGLGYRYGLVSYLWPRARGQVYTPGVRGCWYDMDTERDRDAKARWSHYLNDVPVHTGHRGYLGGVPGYAVPMPYTNLVATINDPWDAAYRYESRPPYTRYRLWSVNHTLTGEAGE